MSNERRGLSEIRQVTPDDLRTFYEIFAVAFGQPFNELRNAKEYYEQIVKAAKRARHRRNVYYMNKYVVEYQNQVIGGLSALPYQVGFDGNFVGMCGIGDVCMLPVYRNMGMVRELMRQTIQDEMAKGTAFSYLYPFSQKYYEKFGFALGEARILWQFSLRHIEKYEIPGSFYLYKNELDAVGFFEAYPRMSGFNMMVKREGCDYTNLWAADPYQGDRFAYLYRDEKEEARGYFIFHKQQEKGQYIMVVDEIIYDSADTIRAILAFATTFTSDYDMIRFYTPLKHNLEQFADDTTLGHCNRELAYNGMVRVINIQSALQAARYQGSGEAVLQIVDPMLAQEKNYAVRYLDGKFSDFALTTRDADAEMSIGDFSTALIGRYFVEDFSYLPKVKVYHPQALSGIFFKKAIYSTTFF
jgi:predicted acetyltransferase